MRKTKDVARSSGEVVGLAAAVPVAMQHLQTLQSLCLVDVVNVVRLRW